MKKRQLALWAVILTLVISTSALAFGAIPEPTAAYYANDFAGVLSDSTIQHIIDKNVELEGRSGGAQIVVVTVDFADGMEVMDYGNELFNSWGIGDTQANNGYLMLLSIGDDDFDLRAGIGLERVLSADVVTPIAREYLDPAFDAQDYDAGVLATFDAIYDILDRHYYTGTDSASGGQDYTSQSATPAPTNTGQPSPSAGYSSSQSGSNIISTLISVIVLLFIIMLIVNLITRPRRRYDTYGGGGYYPPPRRTVIFFPWTWGRRRRYPPPPPRHYGGGYGHGHGHGYGGAPTPGPAPRPPAAPKTAPRPAAPKSSGGMFSGGGGSARAGGGVGRSSSSSSSPRPSAPRPSSPRPSGGGSVGRSSGGSSFKGGGGMSRGGGGSSRGGGGVGRRK